MFSEADWAELESSRDATAARLVSASNLLPGDVRHRGFYRSAFATEGLKAYADAIPPEGRARAGPGVRRRGPHLPQHSAPAGAVDGARVQDWGGSRCRSVARGIRHPCVSRPRPRVAARQPHRLGRLPVGLRRGARGGKPHGGGDRLGLRAHELLQLCRRQGPLADRQLHRHGEEPALDGPRSGRGPTGCTSPRASTRARCAATTANGTIIYPKHVHKALRRYLGIANTPGGEALFRSTNTEDFAFFS